MATQTLRTSTRALCAAAALSSACAAHAAINVYSASLSGASESPPNTSPGTAFATVTIDTTANTMRVQFAFIGLLGPFTASHIHAATALPLTGTAGVATATFSPVPFGATSGTYDNVFELLSSSTYNSTYLTDNGGTPATAETALLAALGSGDAYINIHTTLFPGGEIRGFLLPQPVPEPATWAMMLLGFGGIGLAVRRARKSKERLLQIA